MNQNPLDQRLRDAISRRPLTETEQAELEAWLSAHPEARADWEQELALSRILAHESAAPVSSNFTSRVLQDIKREENISQRGRVTVWGGWWRALVPRPAVGLVGLVIVALVVFIHQRNEISRQSEIAQNLAALASVQTLPSVELLQDFDAIRSLNIAATADEDILALKDELQTLNP